MKIVILSLTLLLFAFTNLFAQPASWSVRTFDTGSLFDVSFVDSLYGWAVGTGGKIYSTTDGGISWNIQIHVTNEQLNGVSFVDRNNGFAVGDNGVILKTTDGGTGWSVHITSPTYKWLKVFFSSTQNGYIITQTNQAKMQRTTDGGLNWNEVGHAGGYSNMWFLDENKGWATGGTEGLVKTSDGVNWDDANANLPHNPQCVSFSTDSIGFVVITSTGGGEFISYMYKTINGGTTWFSVDTLHNTLINRIYFIDSLNGWASGWNCDLGTACSLSGGSVYHTSDGGTSWTRDVLQPTSFLYSCTFYDINHGWVVGGHVANVAPMVVCRFLNTTVGVKDIGGLPSRSFLNQNYPNPFNPSTKISFALASQSFVTIKVYDLLGREIATLLNGKTEAGEHLVNWNATNRESGVYLYRIMTEKKVETRKMILVR